MAKIGFFGFIDFDLYGHGGNAILAEKKISQDLNLKIGDCDLAIIPFCPVFDARLDNLFRVGKAGTVDSSGEYVFPEERVLGLLNNPFQVSAADLAYAGIKLALEEGTHVCLLYCTQDMEQFRYCEHGTVLGGKFLKDEGLVEGTASLCNDLVPVAERLSPFIRRFSSSEFYFQYSDENKQFKHVICCLDNDTKRVCGFALEIGRSLLYVLPVNPVAIDQKLLYNTLSECLLSDCEARLVPQASPILESFQFEVEKPLRQKKQKVLASLEQIDEAIAKHQEPKDILFLRDDPLADRLPQWLANYFEIRTRRHDEYVEDFWLLGEGGNEVAICEAKGLSSNVKREYITQLVQHREQRDLPDDFPSILFANTFAEANSVKDKDRQRIGKLEYQKAVKNHVLIVRTLDLVRMLDLVWQKKLDISKIRELLLSETGWLKVTDQGHEVFRD